MNAEALVKYSIENWFVGTWFHYTGKKYNTLKHVYCNVNSLVRVRFKLHEYWLLTNNGNSTLFHKFGYWYKNLLVIENSGLVECIHHKLTCQIWQPTFAGCSQKLSPFYPTQSWECLLPTTDFMPQFKTIISQINLMVIL